MVSSIYSNLRVPGSGFSVQRLQSIDTADKGNQNLAYPSYSTEWNGVTTR